MGKLKYDKNGIKVLKAQDVTKTLSQISTPVATTILDPWYNKGIGGVVKDYDEWLQSLVEMAARFSDHIFVWGFPEIVHNVLNKLPEGIQLVTWLTWYYKNCPSVIRGWRSAQNACLHLSRRGAKLYPEHFLNGDQKDRFQQKKMRFIPGPSSVIEVPLNVGFVGKEEQTGHKAQKPIRVFEPLVLMTTQEGDTVLDPMCGSGTTGEVCRNHNRKAILCDLEDEFLEMTARRLENAVVLV